MYSGYTSRKQNAQETEELRRRVRVGRVVRTASTNADMYKTQSLARTEQWVERHANSKAAKVLTQGSTLLIHPDQHQFRDYSPVGSVYVRRYERRLEK